MRPRRHRSFAVASVVTAWIFGGAPVAHFALVDHSSGETDGGLAHVNPCILGHDEAKAAIPTLTEECVDQHEAESCDAAALLRSAGHPPLDPSLPDRAPFGIGLIQATGLPDYAQTIYRLAPKASPPHTT